MKNDPIKLVRLDSLTRISSGSPELTIGLIDGPIDFTHPAFQNSHIRTVNGSDIAACKNASSLACMHGTFIAGILCSNRCSAVLGICPDCELVLRPIFTSDEDGNENLILPSSSPEELANAIIDTVKAGARIINLSIGLKINSLVAYPQVQEACNYALAHEVIIVSASGNQGTVSFTPLLNYPWVIPVAACNEYGIVSGNSNIGRSIGTRGLLAPGINITSTSSGGGFTTMSGSSVAVPFVTGTLALLWSLFPEASAAELIFCVRNTVFHHRTVTPPLLDAKAAWVQIKKYMK